MGHYKELHLEVCERLEAVLDGDSDGICRVEAFLRGDSQNAGGVLSMMDEDLIGDHRELFLESWRMIKEERQLDIWEENT